jgi:hypothetical protein
LAQGRIVLALALAAALATACRGILDVDALPPDPPPEPHDGGGSAPAREAGAGRADASDTGSPPPVDPAWAQWHVPLDITPSSYDLGEVALVDRVTGLVWQRTGGTPAAWAEAAAYCASIELEGQPARLPTRIELLSIMDFRLPVEGNPFPPVFLDPSWNCFWTISRNASQRSHWLLATANARLGTSTRDETRCVPRCVAAAPYDPDRNAPPPYEVAGGIVRDPRTELGWEAYASANAGERVGFEEAVARCAALRTGGHSDWRLPTVKELATLIDERRVLPALDPRVAGEPTVYWSSTPHEPKDGVDAGGRPLRWRVSFVDGVLQASDSDVAFPAFVAATRCVRGAPAADR